jgi:hypothetical protein
VSRFISSSLDVESFATPAPALGHSRAAANKKADVVEHSRVLDHVGLLITGPSGKAGLPLMQSSDLRADQIRAAVRHTLFD